MEVVFRTDASIRIGTGHVMRCLNLADALAARGAVCRFICKEHSGHLLDSIQRRGYRTDAIPVRADQVHPEEVRPAHAEWLGGAWYTDADSTLAAIGAKPADWVVVDHYALDAPWEGRVRDHCRHLMVIDDLADREHECEILLDQNFGRKPSDYRDKVPERCQTLIGPMFALIAPDFARIRSQALARRDQARLQHILVAMGGVDADNFTSQVLQTLSHCRPVPGLRVTVLMGAVSPWLDTVRDLAARMPWPTEVLAGVSHVAQLMCDSDAAVGAVGGMAWERCCLGLPTVAVALADNQRPAASALHKAEAVLLCDAGGEFQQQLHSALESLADPGLLRNLSRASSVITDGSGCGRVVEQLLERAN